MFAPAGLALTALLITPAAPAPQPIAWTRFVHGAEAGARPRVTIWTSRDEDPYNRGERARVYFKADDDAYITVLRVDTDGRVRVLFPREPWEDNFAGGGRTFEVLGRDDNEAFIVDDAPGVGYVFAVASTEPFRYDDIVQGDHWDYRAIADGRVEGDPYVALTDIASRIAGSDDYDYDIIPYYVERHYDYPRFVCYDCHSYSSYSNWDPYGYRCSRFRIVIYNDPFYRPYRYYPYRYYGGRRVVVVRPYRPGPRYVFKDADHRYDYVTKVRERDGAESRRDGDRGRTGADVGGRGTVPIPGGSSGGGRRPAPRDATPPNQPPDGRGDPGTPGRRGRGDPHDIGPGQGDPHDTGPGRGDPHDNGRRPSGLAPRDVRPPTREGGTRPESQGGARRPAAQPGNDRNAQPQRERRDEPRAEPRATSPDRRETRGEPRAATPERREARGEPPAATPERREASPPREPQGKSTGEPELNRRRP